MSIKGKIKKLIEMSQHTKLIAIPQTVDSNRLLSGKSALIVGGTSGIGLAMAGEFMKHGCEVVIAGRSSNKIEKAIESIGEELHGIIIDITLPSLFDDKIIEAIELLSNKRIDILVNCAGIRTESLFGQCSEGEFDKVLSTNVKGMYMMCQSVAKYMIDNKIHGHILNVSSSAAMRPAQTPYQISKWAVRGMTLGLADALFPYGIIVNGIAPGPTATEMLNMSDGKDIGNSAFQLGRYEIPREISQLAVFMVSPLGDVIVGDTLYACGGSGIISLHK